MHLKSSLG